MSILELIVELYEKSSLKIADSELRFRISEILDENWFAADTEEPIWFAELLARILEGRATTERTHFKYPVVKPDVYNLLVELEDLIPAKWVDFGDMLEVEFPFGIKMVLATADWYEVQLA